MNRLGDDDHTALEQEPQGGLGGGLAVLFADLRQHGVGEHILAPLGKRAPGLDLAAVLLQIFPGHLLLLEHVSLHLVHSGLDLGEVLDVQIPVRTEVGNADGPELTGLVQLLHGPVGAVVVAEGLVDQQQVQVIGAQLAHGLLNGGLGLLIARVGDPDLGGQEEFLPGQAALRQRRADALLIVIGLGGVDAAVAHIDGVQHAALGVLRRGLIHAVAQLRHFDAVVQSHILHYDTSKF